MTGASARSDLRVGLQDGTVVGYAEMGDPGGRPVVHLHGTPSCRLEAQTLWCLNDGAVEALGIRLLAPDRPGMGRSPFRRHTVSDYPELVRGFADVLGLERFAVLGTSGGGKYACACAWQLPDRVTQLVLAASTCSLDLPGAVEDLSQDDRRLYRFADRTPWLFRVLMTRFARSIRGGDIDQMFAGRELGLADEELLTREDYRQGLTRLWTECFRQGTRGPAHDYALEARPWRVPLDAIHVPTVIWHGEDDHLVPPSHSRVLGEALPSARSHFVPGLGHLSLGVHHASDILRSAHDD